MTNTVRLTFEITAYCHDENTDQLGKIIEDYLRHCWLDGDDILDIEYKGYEVLE